MGHIFISYSHEDKEYVEKLEKKLISEGFDVWIDHRIDYADDWLRVIEKNLDECDAFIIVMSKNSKASNMVQNEITRARDKDKTIFPVLLDGENWLVVQRKQYVDVRDGSLPPEKFYKRFETVTKRKKKDLNFIEKSKRPEFNLPVKRQHERGFLNLVEIGFPKKIYIADWNFTRKELGSKKRNDRKLVQEALSQQGLKFSVDWVTTERQIITFCDMRDPHNNLGRVVDQGTITELETEEFYEDDFYRNKFVELLQKSLQQKLFRLGIVWQHAEKEFIFTPENTSDKVREIVWKGKVSSKRIVYRQIPNLKNKSLTYCHEHFAFKDRFYYFDSRWFWSIIPDWFYSSDGYKRAGYVIEDKRAYKKRVEANQNVSTHVRFIHAFVSSNNPKVARQIDMFSDQSSFREYPFLWLKNIAEIEEMPVLSDDDWLPSKTNDMDNEDTFFSKKE